MNSLKSLLIISAISLILSGSVPKVDVYMESLCPDSIHFIENSFKAFQANPSKSQLADVTIFSSGNSNDSWNGSKWVFTCQHGDNECYGNAIETCAKVRLPKEAHQNFIICIEHDIFETKKDFNASTRNCLEKDIAESVIACANGAEGNVLLHEEGLKTPIHTFIPWIVIDGVHDEPVVQQVLEDMVKYFCQGKPDLEGCKSQADSGLTEVEKLLKFLH
jgi:interferon gamma-inducible protein 30